MRAGKTLNDDHWMSLALQRAQESDRLGEVPVGAILVQGHTLIAEGWNQPLTTCDPTAHAEIVAIRKAAHCLHNYRLVDTTLYVTLEPCIMCAGAIIHARIKRVVFGAYDPKSGAAGSRFDILRDTRHNHQVDCKGGVLATPCGEILQCFFKAKRLIHSK